MPGMPRQPPIDPKAAMEAMQGVMKNPAFMQMAEKLGTQMMRPPDGVHDGEHARPGDDGEDEG